MISKIGLYRDPRKKKPWVIRWFGEYDPATGKQKRYSKSFVLKRDAEAFQSGLATDFRKGQRRDKPEEIALGNFCADWLRTRRSQLRAETLRLYRETIGRLCDHFGPNFPLCRVTPRAAAGFVAELQPLNTQRGGQLSNWTRHKALRNCKSIFQGAVTWELLHKNPFRGVKAPKLTMSRWHYVKPAEYRRLLDAAPSMWWKACYALAYTGGLRFGELFSLTWVDIDFEIGEVKIEKRPATSKMPPFDVKDYESRRIPLPKHMLDILTELQSLAPEQIPYALLDEQQYDTAVRKWLRYQSVGRPWRNQDMVNNVPREFRRHLKWAEIKPNGTLSLHTLRKSCIQNWANELPINVTKELAGHSSITTTQKYYLQVDEYHRAKAALVIDSLLAKTEPKGEKSETTDARMTPRVNSQ